MNDTEYGQLRVNHMITGNRLATRVATVSLVSMLVWSTCVVLVLHISSCVRS